MDLGFLSEALSGAGGLSLGLIIRYFWPRVVERIIERVVEQQAVESHGRTSSPARAVVRFQYADSSADIKTLLKHTLKDEMPWAGKRFKHTHTGKDGIHIYIEQED